MMLKKSNEELICGIVVEVKASISRRRPGTAAEISLAEPSDERMASRSKGYAVISQAFALFGTCL